MKRHAHFASRPALSLLLLLIAAMSQASAALPLPQPPTLEASAWLLEDFRSGAWLASHDPDARVEPASITKMMTTYIAFSELTKGNISLDDKVTVSERAWRKGGSKMFIKVNDQVRVEDLLRGIVVQSGNDAAIALAEYIAGSEDTFAGWMNTFATELGMLGTNYMNATGWPDDNHYTTARDIAILARALISNYPDYYALYSEKEFTYNDITQSNRNKLLWSDSSVDGMKTGHTESAGYCLVSSAQRDGMRLISVVLGTGSKSARVAASRALLNYGFRFWDSTKLYDANSPITSVRPWKGAFDTLDLGVAEPLYASVPRGRRGDVIVAPKVPDQLFAPIQAGQTIGSVEITLDGDVLGSAPLVALRGVPKGGIISQLMDEVRLLIFH